MAPSHFLTTQFGKDHPMRGQAFLDSVKLFCKDKLLHHACVTGSCPKLVDLSGSHGHFPRKKTFDWEDAAPELEMSMKDQEERILREFDELNDVNLTGWQRQELFNTQDIGGLLVVTKGDTPGGPPFIMVIGNVVASTVVTSDVADGGAPRWEGRFGDLDLAPYLIDPTVKTHLAFGSVAHQSRQSMPSSREELMDSLSLLALTPGERVFNGKHSGGQFFITVALPNMCDLPLGLLWPVGTTVDQLLESITGRTTPYDRFGRLLRQRKELFGNWLNAVKDLADSFAIRVNSALPLCNAMTASSDEVVDVFIALREQALWRAYCDSVYFGDLPDTDESFEDRNTFILYLFNVNECYPTELGLDLPITSRPFVATLFKPKTPWPHTDWLIPFVLQDDEVPDYVRRFGQATIPIDPEDDSPLERLRLPAGSSRGAKFAKAFSRRRQNAKTTSANTTATPAKIVPAQQSQQGSRPTTGTAINPITPSPDVAGTMQQRHDSNAMVSFAAPARLGNPNARNESPSLSLLSENALDRPQAMALAPNTGHGAFHSVAHAPHGHGVHNMTGFHSTQPSHPLPTAGSCFSPDKGGMHSVTPHQGFQHGFQAYTPTQLTYASHQTMKPRYTPMVNATLTTHQARSACSPVFLVLGLLFAQPVPTSHSLFSMEGMPLSRELFLYVREPTSWGKQLLQIWEKHGAPMVSSLRSAIHVRGMYPTCFQFVGQITMEMVNRLPFSSNSISSGTQHELLAHSFAAPRVVTT